MKVEFTERAVTDLRNVSADSRQRFGDAVAAALERRIQEIVAHIANFPEGAPEVIMRPGVRFASLGRYPYRIFYRILENRVRILHIRHTSRRPWRGEGN